MCDDQGMKVISRHPTTDGVIVYARGDDGQLQVWLQRRDTTPELVTEGGGLCPL